MIRYIWTFAALLALTALTFALSFVDMGPWNTVAAMAIGLTKSLLVVLWFMHIVEHENSSRVAFAVAFALAACLVVFTVLDVRTRAPEPGAGPTSVSLLPNSPAEVRFMRP